MGHLSVFSKVVSMLSHVLGIPTPSIHTSSYLIGFFFCSSVEPQKQTLKPSAAPDLRSVNIEQYVKLFPWLYYNHVDKGYKCKTCEMFPPLDVSGPNRQIGTNRYSYLTTLLVIWKPTNIQRSTKVLSNSMKVQYFGNT